MKEYKFKIGGHGYEVAVNSIEGNKASVSVNGVEYEVEMEENAPAVSAPVRPAAPKAKAEPVQQSRPQPQSSAPSAGKDVTSPLPGVILSVNVTVGASVKKGQCVAVLEAMKMENEIEAEKDGKVTAIHVSKGDSVLEGAKLLTIE